MSSSNSNRRAKMEKEREKQVQDRLQVLICEMLKDEDNKYCVDCDSKGLSNSYVMIDAFIWLVPSYLWVQHRKCKC